MVFTQTLMAWVAVIWIVSLGWKKSRRSLKDNDGDGEEEEEPHRTPKQPTRSKSAKSNSRSSSTTRLQDNNKSCYALASTVQVQENDVQRTRVGMVRSSLLAYHAAIAINMLMASLYVWFVYDLTSDDTSAVDSGFNTVGPQVFGNQKKLAMIRWIQIAFCSSSVLLIMHVSQWLTSPPANSWYISQLIQESNVSTHCAVETSK
jgi:hypothetical protein